MTESKHDPCGGMVSDSGGCDHLRGEHPNNGPCEYKESTGPGAEEEDVCNCEAFVELPADIEPRSPLAVPNPAV